MMKEIELQKNCPNCQVEIGQKHVMFCSITRCRNTGDQLLMCYTHPDEREEDEVYDHECEPCIWTGEWPGVKVCRDNNWYTDPKSIWGYTEDLNSIPFRAKWNPELGDWEARK